jgi:glycosyltransferase involved in cell wall biosynthesis
MQSKICVLQVIPNLDVSGASQGYVDVANFLSEKNYNSYILTHSGPKSIEVKDSNEKVFYAPVNSKNPLKIFLNAIKIIQLIKKLNITIVHARSRAPAWSSYFACALTGAKFITTFHGTYNFSNPLKKYYNSIMLKTNGTIAISEFINDHINNCYPTNNYNIRTIARGVDLDFFDPNNYETQQVELIIKEFNIDYDAIKILLAGRITGWKGHKLLLQAISTIIKKTNHKFEIIFVGPDENYKLKNS